MANSYFRFRQFTIQQDRSAMKVCTDSCILGAWTATRIKNARRILDIGTGTGLLTLMLAQKNTAQLDAIELDPEAFEQATENFAASPWSANIRPLKGDVRQHLFPHLYDFIITNPPFFESDLLSPSPGKNKAKHAGSLSLEELLSVIRSVLEPAGAFSILLPFHRTDYFEKLAANKGYFPQEKMLIRQTPSHPLFRSVSLYASPDSPYAFNNSQPWELIIRNERGNETPELVDLLGDYYLVDG